MIGQEGFRHGSMYDDAEGRPTSIVEWMQDVGEEAILAAVMTHCDLAGAYNLDATSRRSFWHVWSHAWTFELCTPGNSILRAGPCGHDLAGPHPLGRDWQ
jgi:hypothetical protein